MPNVTEAIKKSEIKEFIDFYFPKPIILTNNKESTKKMIIPKEETSLAALALKYATRFIIAQEKNLTLKYENTLSYLGYKRFLIEPDLNIFEAFEKAKEIVNNPIDSNIISLLLIASLDFVCRLGYHIGSKYFWKISNGDFSNELILDVRKIILQMKVSLPKITENYSKISVWGKRTYSKTRTISHGDCNLIMDDTIIAIYSQSSPKINLNQWRKAVSYYLLFKNENFNIKKTAFFLTRFNEWKVINIDDLLKDSNITFQEIWNKFEFL